MRSDKKRRYDRFVQEIDQIVKNDDPKLIVQFEGFKWVRQSQPAWCELLEVSGPTLRGLAKHPPIVATTTKGENGKPIVLYRLGDEPHESARHVANTMAKFFRQRHGLKSIPKNDWGCLVGLAELWPQGHQFSVFKTCVDNWSDFMGGVKLYQSDGDEASFKRRYYNYPIIKIIRKYPHVGLELHITNLQGSREKPEKSLIRSYQVLHDEYLSRDFKIA